MIEVKHLNKFFGKKQILSDISLQLSAGKNNLIIGQSGSGKTVLMKCLVGLHQPDSGEILFDSRNFLSNDKKVKKDIRKDIGMVFQNGALFDSISVLHNVMFPLDMFTEMTYTEKKERAYECLAKVDLKDAGPLSPSELSGGMKKRVAIARAIVTNPKYLFCDEPNSGLDPKTASLIDELIARLTEEYNITTVVNTHDMNSVLQIGDLVHFIYQGNLWWTGSKNDILQTDNQEVIQFLEASEITRRILKTESL